MEMIGYISLGLNVVVLIVLFLIISRMKSLKTEDKSDAFQKVMADEFSRNRTEQGTAIQNLRQEITSSFGTFSGTLNQQITTQQTAQQEFREVTSQKLTENNEQIQKNLNDIRTLVEGKLSLIQQSNETKMEQTRNATNETLDRFSKDQKEKLEGVAAQLKEIQTSIETRLTEVRTSSEQKQEQMRVTMETQLKDLQEKNDAKLEQMRLTVDEKLHKTLEERLGQSFSQVSENLTKVYTELGEMKKLAGDVSNLNQILTKVKPRGIVGEIMLGNLIEQILAPGQYEENVKVNPEKDSVVEFAVKIPSRDDETKHVWLPIDAKFPLEIYQQLMEETDPIRLESCRVDLQRKIKGLAKEIHDKYIISPYTTQLAIMYLPIEGLFAEALRDPVLFNECQNQYHVILSGPTTLAAVLNSLQIGFRTLALEKRADEVWRVLGAVKTEFGKFGEILEKTKKKLESACNDIEKVQTKKRAVERKLHIVERLPEAESQSLLGIDDLIDDENPEIEIPE